MPPIESAVTKYGGAVQPMIKKTRHVSSKVATVIPEMGFDDEPISPVSREETVTKRKPNSTIRNAPSQSICNSGIHGICWCRGVVAQIAATSKRDPMPTTDR